MANKYSNFQFKDYKSVFVDPQTTEIQKILRSRWDENRSRYDVLDNSLKSMQVGSGDQDLKDKAVDNLNSTFENSIQNKNWEDQSGLISTATNDFLGNEGLNLARESYKIHTESEAEKRKIRSEQGAVLFDWDYVKDPNTEDGYARDANGELMKNDKFSNHRSFYLDENTGEMVRNVYSPEHEKMGDWNGIQNSMISTIQKDPVQLGQLADVYNISTGQLSGYLASGKGLSSERAAALSEGLATTYTQSTAEGKQQVRHLMEQNVNPSTGVPYTEKEAIAQISQQFISKINQQVGTDIDYRDNKVLLETLKNQGSVTNNTPALLGDQLLSAPYASNTDPTASQREFNPLDAIISQQGTTQKRVTIESGPWGDTYIKTDYFNGSGKYVFANGDAQVDTAISSGDQDAAISALSDQFKQAIEAQGFGDDPTLSAEQAASNYNNKYINTHMDQYVAYLMTENAGFRSQFSNDKDFIQAMQGSRASLASKQDSYFQIDNQAFQLHMGDKFKSGNYKENKSTYVDFDGSLHESTLGDGSNSGVFTAMADTYAGKGSFFGTGLSTRNKRKGNRGNNSGRSPGNTLEALTDAQSDINNWNVIGFDPNKGYKVQLNVPAYDYGSGNTNPFKADLYIEASETITAATSNLQAFTAPYENGTMNATPTMNVGADANGNIQIATINYYPEQSRGNGTKYDSYGASMIVRNYSPEDIENGMPVEGAQPVGHGHPMTDANGTQLHNSETERHYKGKDNIYDLLAHPLKTALNYSLRSENIAGYTSSSGTIKQ